jgi:Secretion system C-terminal sorting domain
MKKIFLICIFYSNSSLFSQGNWEVINIPSLYDAGRLNTIYFDSLENDLWMGGIIKHSDSIGSVPFNFVLRYDGINWKHYGPFLGDPISSICRYQDKIVIGGSFFNYNYFYATPDEYRALAFIRADTVGHFDGMGAIGLVAGLNVIDDELYVFGSFDTICGIVAHDAAKYNGTEWSNIYDFPKLDTYLTSGERYNDKMYLAGGFSDLEYFGDNGYGITYYVNPDWELPGGALNYGLATQIEDMIIYNNELYVGGQISKLAGNAGNGIQKWNGTEWSAVGDHLRGENGELGGYDPAYDLKVHNNELYIAGSFEYAGDLLANCIVKWDGEKYCSFGGDFNYPISSIAFFQDTLYIAGSFSTIDGIQTHQGLLAKYIGGNTVFECGEVGVKENDALLQLGVYPNPANSQQINVLVTNKNGKNLDLIIYNNVGQVVYSLPNVKDGNNTVNINTLANGYYVVLIKDNNLVVDSGRFIKE